MAWKIFSHLEQLWDPVFTDPTALSVCFEGFCENKDPILLQSCCLLAISMLETNGMKALDSIKLLLIHFRSSVSLETFSPIICRLSQIVARQEALWRQNSLLNVTDSFKPFEDLPVELYPGSNPAWSDRSSPQSIKVLDENFGIWLTDLGSPHWVAFTSLIEWNEWLWSMKLLLAECSGGEEHFG